jgi:hypothetical protein
MYNYCTRSYSRHINPLLTGPPSTALYTECINLLYMHLWEELRRRHVRRRGGGGRGDEREESRGRPVPAEGGICVSNQYGTILGSIRSLQWISPCDASPTDCHYAHRTPIALVSTGSVAETCGIGCHWQLARNEPSEIERSSLSTLNQTALCCVYQMDARQSTVSNTTPHFTVTVHDMSLCYPATTTESWHMQHATLRYHFLHSPASFC